MGDLAGAFGVITFPDVEAVKAWRRVRVAHTAHRDWVGLLKRSTAPDETVARRLARIAKQHDCEEPAIRELALDGQELVITYDGAEERSRDDLGDLAALVRSAAPLGAKGSVWFLSTAGSEGKFGYALVLDGRGARLAELRGKALTAVYARAAYRAFQDHVVSLVEGAFAPSDP
jgi:hypothetical protein